jgi:hypothetical protein
MNWLQWVTVCCLGVSCLFLVFATLNIRLTGRILARKAAHASPLPTFAALFA